MEQELNSIRNRFKQVNQKLIEREKSFEILKKEADEITIQRDELLCELQVLNSKSNPLQLFAINFGGS